MYIFKLYTGAAPSNTGCVIYIYAYMYIYI